MRRGGKGEGCSCRLFVQLDVCTLGFLEEGEGKWDEQCQPFCMKRPDIVMLISTEGWSQVKKLQKIFSVGI